MTRFIIRMDDACPTMEPEPWRRLEAACLELDVRPIVGVIPACEDPTMRHASPDPDFWARVRRWQAAGWTIALHGLHHVYHPDPPGARALVPFHRRGEFVGLGAARQSAMIAEAWGLFEAEGVAPDFFMAPSHSFDADTLAALQSETPIRWITDGLSYRAFRREGFNWLPQQLWGFRRIPFGTWTVCLHPSTMELAAVDTFIAEMRSHRAQIATVAELRETVRPYGAPDAFFNAAYWAYFRGREGLKRRLGR